MPRLGQALADTGEEDTLKGVLGILESGLLPAASLLTVMAADSADLPVVMYFRIVGMERFSAAVN